MPPECRYKEVEDNSSSPPFSRRSTRGSLIALVCLRIGSMGSGGGASGYMGKAGSTDPALSLNERVPCGAFMVPFCLELPYFFLQVHFSDGLLQPTHTPFLISLPQVLHGLHPQVWHILTSLIPGTMKRNLVTSLCSGR